MKLFIDTVMKRIYLFNIVAWTYREKIGFPVCKMENFAGLQAHRKRRKSARTRLTRHHTLNEERSARFTAQHLSALLRKLGYLFIRVDRTCTRPPVRTTLENQREMFHMLASVWTCNMILLIHVVVSWHLSKQGIRWPVLHDRIAGSCVDPSRLRVLWSLPLTSF